MKVAVIGAGWAGCAAAVEATRLGQQVTLFEASR
ncbi:MAG: FAD-dependent oxidoreductase, partial [Pseudomonadota bacterium]|nr:FAD-dependent oxidoreductase [Pseudomonadota bacterium]